MDTTMTDARAQRAIDGLAMAFRNASLALDPMIAGLQRDGRDDDAQRCMTVASDLLGLSSQANAIAVSTLFAAASNEIADLERVNAQMAACAQRLAKSEANVTKFVGIATAAAQVVAKLTGPIDLLGAGKSLATLVDLLGAQRA